jgi:hypothetical protein
VLRIVRRTCSAVSVGLRDSSSAPIPAASGEAEEVPLKLEV